MPIGPTALINGGLLNSTSAGTFNAYGVMLPIGLGVVTAYDDPAEVLAAIALAVMAVPYVAALLVALGSVRVRPRVKAEAGLPRPRRAVS